MENLLRKPIEELDSFGDVTFECDNLYTLKLSSDSMFYKAPNTKLIIKTDDDNKVESICINYPMILDELFYNEMIHVYGNPSHLLALEERGNDGKTNGFDKVLAKGGYAVKDVSFDEKPFFIFWDKASFKMRLTFYYDRNITQLTLEKS